MHRCKEVRGHHFLVSVLNVPPPPPIEAVPHPFAEAVSLHSGPKLAGLRACCPVLSCLSPRLRKARITDLPQHLFVHGCQG